MLNQQYWTRPFQKYPQFCKFDVPTILKVNKKGGKNPRIPECPIFAYGRNQSFCGLSKYCVRRYHPIFLFAFCLCAWWLSTPLNVQNWVTTIAKKLQRNKNCPFSKELASFIEDAKKYLLMWPGCSYKTWMWNSSVGFNHGLRTTNKDLFHQNPKLVGLGK